MEEITRRWMMKRRKKILMMKKVDRRVMAFWCYYSPFLTIISLPLTHIQVNMAL